MFGSDQAYSNKKVYTFTVPDYTDANQTARKGWCVYSNFATYHGGELIHAFLLARKGFAENLNHNFYRCSQ